MTRLFLFSYFQTLVISNISTMQMQRTIRTGGQLSYIFNQRSRLMATEETKNVIKASSKPPISDADYCRCIYFFIFIEYLLVEF